MSTPPSVLFRSPSGQPIRLYPGDLIGRGSFSTLLIDELQISEAHALLSLRGASLQLLTLRGEIRLDGEHGFRGEITLEAGQRIRLADDIVLEVLEVATPEYILALDGLESGRVLLTTPEYQLGGTPLSLDGTPVEVELWLSSETWMHRVGGETQPLQAGTTIDAGGTTLTVSMVDAETASTRGTDSPKKVSPPPSEERIQLTIHPTHTVVQPPGKEAIHITRTSARILHVTACFTQEQGAAGWDAICGEIWPKVFTRGNWDQRKNYLRRKLTEAGIRDTFFVYAGGQVWLDLNGPELVTIIP